MKLSKHYSRQIMELMQNSKDDEHAILQFANLENQNIIESIIDNFILEGSKIHGIEHLDELYNLAKQGHSVLFLSEHYSNFDIPVIFYLIKKQLPQGKAIAEKLVALATRKLNEASEIVRAFAAGYNRITVYAARDVKHLEETDTEEFKQAQEFNKGALMHMTELKNNGYIIFMFPAGTRYRPGKPETKEPVPQVVSFIKRFDYVVFAGISGLLLKVDPEGQMAEEIAQKDVISIYLSKVQSGKEFCKQAVDEFAESTKDSKEAIIEKVKKEFDVLHEKAIELREQHLPK